MSALLVLLTCLVLVLVVPVGIRLVQLPLLVGPGWWVAVGLLAVVALLQHRGPYAVFYGSWYAVLCALAAAAGVLRLLRDREVEPVRAATGCVATAFLAGGAGALLVERSGHPLLGFDTRTWQLTVLHLTVAGFAAGLLSGLTHQAAPSRTSWVGLVGVPSGTALVAVGHFAGAWTELAGAVTLTAGLLATSWVALRGVVRWADDGGQLLGLSAVATPLTMGLAVWWALAEALGTPHLTLAQTAATHGVLNALGVGLCGVWGWTTLAKEQL